MALSEKYKHLSLKVILGYIVVLLIAVFAVIYIYGITKNLANKDETDEHSRLKVYLVTHTLSLLYESEALGQLMQPNKKNYNQLLDRALLNMDSLKQLTTDSVQLLKIDSIHVLLERKRVNTRNLLDVIKKSNIENFYTQNIQQAIDSQDTIQIEKLIEIQQDTIFLKSKKRNFFKRLGDVFFPSYSDTNVVVGTTKQQIADTLYQNQGEVVSSVLKGIQDSVTYQRKKVDVILNSQVANLQYNNGIITAKINQLLRDIEEEAMFISLKNMNEKQNLLKETSHLLIGILIVAAFIVGLFLFLILKDISRSRYYRIQLEKSKKYAEDLMHDREKLMLMISHDIRAPLSSIIGSLELLNQHNMDDRQKDYVHNMAISAKHIFSLVNNVLDVHRLDSGKIKMNPLAFELNVLFKDIYESFKPSAETKKIDFSLSNEINHASYVIDPILIRQIVENLLSNAFKFTQEGLVELNVRILNNETAEHVLIIQVNDTGPGMSEEDVQKIGKDFIRLPQNEHIEGVGLGLSIARKLIELLSGEFIIKSTLGKGSQFEVRLPVVVAENQAANFNNRTPFDLPKAYTAKNIVCLLVDDDSFQLKVTAELLQQINLKAITCNEPKKIVEMLHNHAIDVLITDLNMPGLNGEQIPHLVRNSGVPKTNRLPIIALSASIDKCPNEYDAMGFSGFLSKPISLEEVIPLLNDLIHAGIQYHSPLNYSSLTAFAADDKDSAFSIIKTFSEELEQNRLHFKTAYKNKDKSSVSELSHKMIPVFIMLKANDLVEVLRQLEKTESALSDDEWRKKTTWVLAQLNSIAKETDAFLQTFENF